MSEEKKNAKIIRMILKLLVSTRRSKVHLILSLRRKMKNLVVTVLIGIGVLLDSHSAS